jgi:hypothetical protein
VRNRALERNTLMKKLPVTFLLASLATAEFSLDLG